MQVRVHNPVGRPAPKDGPLGIRRDFPEENPCSTCGQGVPKTPTMHMGKRDRHAWALQQCGRPWIPNPAEEETGCIEALGHVNLPGIFCQMVAPPPHPTEPGGAPKIMCCAQPGVFFIRGGSICPEGANPIGSFIAADKSAVLVCRRAPDVGEPPIPPRPCPPGYRRVEMERPWGTISGCLPWGPGAMGTGATPPSPLTAGAMLSGRRQQRAFKHRLAAAGGVANPERVRNCNLGALALAMSATDPQGYQHWVQTRLDPELAREQNPGEGALLLSLAASDPFGYYRQMARQPNPPLVPIGNQLVPWDATRTTWGGGNYSRPMFSPNASAFPMLNNLAPMGPPWVFNPGSAELAYAYQPAPMAATTPASYATVPVAPGGLIRTGNPTPPRPPPPPPRPITFPPEQPPLAGRAPAQAQVLGVGPMSSVPMGSIHNPTFWPGGPRGNPTRQAYWSSR